MSSQLREDTNKQQELTFLRNYIQVVQGAQSCLDQKLLIPSLILIYTLIDTLAWASSDKTRGVQKHFEAWVNAWIGSRVACTATELYAARCGILHTLTSKAELTAAGKARQIAYAWGTARSEDLQATIDYLGDKTVVAVHVGDLFQAVRDAMAEMLEKSDSDPALAIALKEAAASHMVAPEAEHIALYLKHVRGAGAQGDAVYVPPNGADPA